MHICSLFRVSFLTKTVKLSERYPLTHGVGHTLLSCIGAGFH